mgnify:CR=1 FL=1
MAKKTGLGKGLDALFSASLVEEETNDNEMVYQLKVSEIEPNKDQPRRIFDEDSLNELAESIKKYGVIQPIIVSKKDDYYQIVAGERRWRASKIAGVTEIPAIVRENDEQKNREIALIENIQREDLNPIEKARGIKLLMDQYNLTQAQVAEIIGKGRSTVTNTLRILNLDPRVIKLAEEGKISEAHCRSIVSIQDPDQQYKLALKIIEKGSSVKSLEQTMKNHRKAQKLDPKYDAIFRDIEDSFQGFFGTKVKLDAKKRSGKIIISYSSNDDLERILSLIK